MQQEMLLIVLLISLWKVCHLKLNFYSEAYSTVTFRQFVCILVGIMRCPSHYSYQRGMIVSQLDGITCTIKLVKIINKNIAFWLNFRTFCYFFLINKFAWYFFFTNIETNIIIWRQVRVQSRPCFSSVRPRNFSTEIQFCLRHYEMQEIQWEWLT